MGYTIDELRAKGYTGLWCDGCGCRFEDSMPCGGIDLSACNPGYVRFCGQCPERFEEDGANHCEFHIETGDCTYQDDDWCVCELPLHREVK